MAALDAHDFVIRRTSGGWEGAVGARVARASNERATLLYTGTILRIDGRRVSDRSPHEIAALLLDRVVDDDTAFASVTGSFVACVVAGARLSAFRSLAGSEALFASDTAVGTRLSALASPEARPDRSGVLAYLLDARSLGYASPTTLIAGVKLVTPGGLLRAEGNGRFVSRTIDRRALSYPREAGVPRERVARELRDLLDEIVADQLAGHDPGHVTCEVSGGLDSSFAASLAGRHRPGARALMYAWPDKPSHRICEADAREVAQHASLALEILLPDELGDLDCERGLGYADWPSSWYWYKALIGPTLASRVAPDSLVLSGFGSDQLFMRSRTIVPRLIRQGKLREAHEVARAAARQGNRSEAHLLVQAAISMLPKRLYSAVSSRFEGSRFNPFELADLEALTAAVHPIPWLSVSMDDLVRLTETLDREGEAADAATLGREQFCSSDLSYLVAPSQLVGRELGRCGIRYDSPFLDLRLLDFVAARVPLSMVHDFEGPPKMLLREAMRHVVPEVVRTRTGTFFHWSGFMARIVDRHAPGLDALLDEVEALGIGVDRRAAAKAFQQLRFGANDPSTQRVHHLFGLALWWRAFRHDLSRPGPEPVRF